jgi:hypothetical protein
MNRRRYVKPFDRHDWVVERPNGEEVRYVIDFYSGRPTAQSVRAGQQPVYLEVRPALDSVSAIAARVSFWFRQKFFPLTLPRKTLLTTKDPILRAIRAEEERTNEK